MFFFYLSFPFSWGVLWAELMQPNNRRLKQRQVVALGGIFLFNYQMCRFRVLLVLQICFEVIGTITS